MGRRLDPSPVVFERSNRGTPPLLPFSVGLKTEEKSYCVHVATSMCALASNEGIRDAISSERSRKCGM